MKKQDDKASETFAWIVDKLWQTEKNTRPKCADKNISIKCKCFFYLRLHDFNFDLPTKIGKYLLNNKITG